MKSEIKRIGRPPITEGDPREKKSITLRRSTWAALEGKRQPGESLAACIDRLLSEGKTTGVWIRSVMPDGSMTKPQYFELPAELPTEPQPPTILRLK